MELTNEVMVNHRRGVPDKFHPESLKHERIELKAIIVWQENVLTAMMRNSNSANT